MSVNDNDTEEEISLFDPKTLVNKNKNSKIKEETPKLNVILDASKNRQKLSKIENKIDKSSINNKITESKLSQAANVNKNSNTTKSETKIISKTDNKIDTGYYENSKDNENKISKEENKNKKFVGNLTDQTKKIILDQKSLNLDSIKQNNIKPQSSSNEINTSNKVEVEVNLNEPLIHKENEKNNSNQSSIEKLSGKKILKKIVKESNLEVEIVKKNISEIQPRIKNPELNKVEDSSYKVTIDVIPSSNKIDLISQSPKQDKSLIKNDIKENINISEKKKIKPSVNNNTDADNLDVDGSTRFQLRQIEILDVKKKIEKINLKWGLNRHEDAE